jgi:putative Holliday junction resolvase
MRVGALRLLGLDVGDRRIGVAVSDPTGAIATPITVYHRRDQEADVRHVVALATEFEASGVVVGLPKNMNGTEGPQAEKTRAFANALAASGMSVSLWDERLSTVEATRRLTEHGRKRRGPTKQRRNTRDRVDSEAAALILQTYLDHVRIRGGHR